VNNNEAGIFGKKRTLMPPLSSSYLTTRTRKQLPLTVASILLRLLRDRGGCRDKGGNERRINEADRAM